MRPVLLDTNAYTAFMQDDKAIIEVIQHAERVAMSPIVIGELLGGFEWGNKTKKNRDELQRFLKSSRIRLLSLTIDTANFYSQVYALLRKKGNPIPSNDIWIAAQALENGCVLCSYDRHFKAVEGLIVASTVSELIV